MEMPVTNHVLYSVQRHIRGFHFFSVEVILNASDYFPSITITTLLRHLEEEQKEDRMSRRTTKPKKMLCALSEGSDQPGHPPSLIRIFTVHSIGSYGPNFSPCGQWRLWSDWADAGRTGHFVFAGRTGHFVGFVMRRLKCKRTRTVDKQQREQLLLNQMSSYY